MEAPESCPCACHTRRMHHLISGVSKQAFQEEEEVGLPGSHSQDFCCCKHTQSRGRDTPSTWLPGRKIRPMPTLGIFDGDDSSWGPSSCAGPQTLQGEATNPIGALENGVLPPSSLGFMTRSTPMPALLSQDEWDVATQWGTLYFDTRPPPLSFYWDVQAEPIHDLA